ncbi:hypothetical protein ACWGTI_00945 [Mesorhizobium sp. ArgA1]
MMELSDGRSVPRIGVGTWAAGDAARLHDTAAVHGEVDRSVLVAELRLNCANAAAMLDAAALSLHIVRDEGRDI